MGWDALQFVRPALIRTASFGAVESPICPCEMSSHSETMPIECNWGVAQDVIEVKVATTIHDEKRGMGFALLRQS